MGLMDSLRGWFSKERAKEQEEEREEAEEILRDPELGRSIEDRRGPGAQPGYAPGAADREFDS
jgi:hypothetical protein